MCARAAIEMTEGRVARLEANSDQTKANEINEVSETKRYCNLVITNY